MQQISMDDNFPKSWGYQKWFKARKAKSNPLKEKLLRKSIEIIDGEPDNEGACREVIEQALEAGLFEVAFGAVRVFSKDSGFDMCVSVSGIFKDMAHWEYMTDEFVGLCEKRVLGAKECRSGFGFNNHFCDQRSTALGWIGKYYFFNGKVSKAMELWASAADKQDVDEVIQKACEIIAENSKSNIEIALSLVDVMKTKSVKAKTLAQLSKHV